MGVTAKQIAKTLKLSEAAVSMALNNKYGVSDDTRRLVVETARNLGYNFSKKQSAIHYFGGVCFLIYKKHGAVVTDSQFFEQLTESVGLACKQRGFKLDITYLYESDDIKTKLKELLFKGYDGFLLLGTEMKSEDFVPFAEIETPFVVLDTYFEGITKDCVLINNKEGAYLATNYLVSKRKSQPGYLHSSYSIGNFEERQDGFYKAIRYNGMSTSRSIVHRLTPSIEGAYEDMKSLLLQEEETASCYFADNDLIAAGALRAFKEFGYEIPKDIAIIGFDNIPLCAVTEPSLTTVNVPRSDLGSLAVERLVKVISGGDSAPIKIEVSTSIVKRNSI